MKLPWIRKEPSPPATAFDRAQQELELLIDYSVEHKQHLDAIEEAKLLLAQSEQKKGDAEVLARMTSATVKLLPQEGWVTPDTLRATARPAGRRINPVVGNHLTFLWLWAGAFVALALTHAVISAVCGTTMPEPGDILAGDEKVRVVLVFLLGLLVPFTYGGLGACAYLMRMTGQFLHDRTFDPNRIPEQRNRLALGALAGGMIVLFVDKPDGFELSSAALGFLAGYSVDFLFQSLDRVMSAILPKVGLDTVAQQLNQKRNELVLRRLRDRLANAKTEEEKKTLDDVIKQLQG